MVTKIGRSLPTGSAKTPQFHVNSLPAVAGCSFRLSYNRLGVVAASCRWDIFPDYSFSFHRFIPALKRFLCGVALVVV